MSFYERFCVDSTLRQKIAIELNSVLFDIVGDCEAGEGDTLWEPNCGPASLALHAMFELVDTDTPPQTVPCIIYPDALPINPSTGKPMEHVYLKGWDYKDGVGTQTRVIDPNHKQYFRLVNEGPYSAEDELDGLIGENDILVASEPELANYIRRLASSAANNPYFENAHLSAVTQKLFDTGALAGKTEQEIAHAYSSIWQLSAAVPYRFRQDGYEAKRADEIARETLRLCDIRV